MDALAEGWRMWRQKRAKKNWGSQLAILKMDPQVPGTLADGTPGEWCSRALSAFLAHKSWATQNWYFKSPSLG